MNLEIGRFFPALPATPPSPARAVGAPVATGHARPHDTLFDAVPPAPTEEVRAHVDRAAEIAAELASHNRELHFSKDQDTGRVVIQVRDLDGNVIRTIPPSHALAVLSGAAL